MTWAAIATYFADPEVRTWAVITVVALALVVFCAVMYYALGYAKSPSDPKDDDDTSDWGVG